LSAANGAPSSAVAPSGTGPSPESRAPSPETQPQPAAACSAVTSDGTATANYVAKFTTACNIEKSLIFDNGTDVGIGTAAPGAFLDTQGTSTATSGNVYGLRSITTSNPAAASSATVLAAFSNAATATGSSQSFTGSLTAFQFEADHNGTGTLSQAYGGYGAVRNQSTGTITNTYSLYSYLKNTTTGTVTNGYGLFVNNPTNAGGGTISKFYGVYISNPTTATTGYGLYSLATTNYLSGNLGINTTTPSAPLEVNGKAKFDNTVTFTASQTFPGTVTGATTNGGLLETGTTLGLLTTCATSQVLAWNGSKWACASAGTGTVTSVGSGAGLTGGPITTSGTLSIANAGVTDTMLATAYSGTGSCASGSFVTKLARAAAPTCAAGAVGTITGVTGGTGISGGGASGDVTLTNTGILSVGVSAGLTTTGGQTPTLGIDTTVVPELAISNTFTTEQFVHGYVDAYGVGNGTALYGFSDSTSASIPTLYIENDDSTDAGDWVFDAVGPSFGGQCTIDLGGNLYCTGTLAPVIKTDDNRELGLYTVQSSENWIEDFGSGTLVNGVATIDIEPQFAKTVTEDASYHVFLTPNGDCEGLYVTRKGASSFEVHELKAGKSNVSFDYRIVAHRKGFEAARLPDLTERLQKKVQMPAQPKIAAVSTH